MVSSNLIDIEVIFTNHPDIRRKLMVEVYDDMSLLNSRIREVCEIYSKLSGLNGLSAYHFQKKTENGLVDLKETGLIGDSIKSKDVIYFELSFHEIWLDIEMTLESGGLSTQISFELKVVLNSDKKEFENTLINLGIKAMAKLIQSDGDYYMFTKLIVNYPISPSKKINEQTVSFDYDSKLTCALKFTNLTNLIYERVFSSEKLKSHSFNGSITDYERSTEVKEYFNYFFEGYLSKLENIAEHNHIIWKYQNDEIVDDDNNSSFYANESRLSLISNFNSNLNINYLNYGDNAKKREMSIFSPNTNTSNTNSPFLTPFGGNGNTNTNTVEIFSNNSGDLFSRAKKTNARKFNQKYKSDYYYMRNGIDYQMIINQYTETYIMLREFQKKFPDTKNIVELTNGVVENFEIENPIDDLNAMPYRASNYYKEDTDRFSFSSKNKKVLIIIGVIVILILIFIIL